MKKIQQNMWTGNPEFMKAAMPIRGRHVIPSAAYIMFPFAAAVSLLPVLAGLRLWDRIPETVYSGIVSVTGQADSMPRPGLVFGLPCLLTVLTIICHIQLWFHQRAGNLPPGFVCVFGRWGMPAFSVLVITTFIRLGAGIPVSVPYLVLCGLGLLLLLAGSRILSMPEGRELTLKNMILSGDYETPAENAAVGSTRLSAGIVLLVLGAAFLTFLMAKG